MSVAQFVDFKRIERARSSRPGREVRGEGAALLRDGRPRILAIIFEGHRSAQIQYLNETKVDFRKNTTFMGK